MPPVLSRAAGRGDVVRGRQRDDADARCPLSFTSTHATPSSEANSDAIVRDRFPHHLTATRGASTLSIDGRRRPGLGRTVRLRSDASTGRR